MKKIFFGLLLLIIINPVYTQTTIRTAPFPIDDVNHINGEVVDFGNNEMYALWSRFEELARVRFYMSKSTDSGTTWQDQVVVFDTIASPANIIEDPYAGTRLIKGNNNRLLLFIKAGSLKHTYFKYSDDGGTTWTPNMRFILTNTFQSVSLRIISVVHLGAGRLILTGSNGSTIAGTKRSTDNGTTWQNWLSLPSPVFLNPALLSIGNGSFYLAGQQQGTSTPNKIYFVKYLSTNTWQDTVLVHEDTSVILSNPRLSRGSGNELYIYYTKTSKVFGKYNNSNIYYSKAVMKEPHGELRSGLPITRELMGFQILILNL
ncbi:MAG: exo-alpha-sialidase [Ignavibacteriales bacterium]|nr:exo-alpha-sialidase [Ignavibacteriales bacterium]